jgi:hypothetical protein
MLPSRAKGLLVSQSQSTNTASTSNAQATSKPTAPKKQKISAKRLAANRANAQKSTGPKTPEGKAASSQNAFKHGLYSEAIVLPGEDPEQFFALRSDLAAEHRPQSLTQQLMVDEIAQHYWRIKRYRTLEIQMFQTNDQKEAGVYRVDVPNLIRCIDLKLWPTIHRALTSAERGFYKALKTLQEMQQAVGFVPKNAVSPAIAEAANQVGFVSQNEVPAHAAPQKPSPVPFRERTEAEQWAEIEAVTGRTRAQLEELFGVNSTT